jgi:uncharacterized membrane protein YjgN (DUF898 family)
MSVESRVEPSFDGRAPASAVLPETRYRPQFHGQAGEYFGIWIVNVLLSVLTLGIYSAWAKVRTERYFYGNTRLAGASFEYLAQPVQILKGRLVAYAVVITLAVAAKFQFLWVLVPLYLLIVALFPLVIRLGIAFRARYSAWRGMRFRFDGSTASAYGAYMGWPIVAMFTLNLLLPWVQSMQHRYLVAGHSFGGERFRYTGESGPYFPAFFIALGLGVLAMIALFGMIAVGAVFTGKQQAAAGATPGIASMAMIYGGILVFYAMVFAISIYLRTVWTNLLWNFTRLGEHRFESTLKPIEMIALYFSNGLAILFSIGLAVPWARVRVARYRAEHLVLVARGSLDDFIGQGVEKGSATGAELSQALDFDLDVAL